MYRSIQYNTDPILFHSTFRNSERLFRDSFSVLLLHCGPFAHGEISEFFSSSCPLVFYPIQYYYYGPITLGPVSYSWSYYIFYPGPITLVPITCGPISYSWSKFHIPILLSFSIFLFLYFFIYTWPCLHC